MPYTTLPDGIRLYYEFTGPEDKPVILQFGGSLFGRQNFGLVNDGFRENFRLLSFDARGYGRSDVPSESYTIEGWADDGAALLDAVGLDRVLVHGTSMGGMIALAFACKYPARCIAACPDVAFRTARCPPQGDLPLLAALRRDDELGRFRRSRHHAGRGLPSPREARGRGHLRDGAGDHPARTRRSRCGRRASPWSAWTSNRSCARSSGRS